MMQLDFFFDLDHLPTARANPVLLSQDLSTARHNYAASCKGGGAPNLASSFVLVYVHWIGLGC
jgi:hypothetical protein